MQQSGSRPARRQNLPLRLANLSGLISVMTFRFELDGAAGKDPIPAMILRGSEPTNEDQPSSHFVVEGPDSQTAVEPREGNTKGIPENGTGSLSATRLDGTASQIDDSWRNEVAARVNRYRARRRPRAPRYPSLTLKFEATEPQSSRRFNSDEPALPSTHQALAMDSALVIEESAVAAVPVFSAPAETGKLIEFPRSLTLPSRPLDELADPVLDRPRILDVPDVAPPPPALGGILMEPAEQKLEERRPGFEIPLQSAPMSRRLAAVAVDAFVVLAACALFGYIFSRTTHEVPPLQPWLVQPGLVQPWLGMAVILTAMFWAGYQFLALVFTGTTPGLRVAKLQLHRFDGNPVPRRLRRWRVLASLLSGVSLGIGHAWCFLDEDQLCWHDRITRTYMAPKSDDPVPLTTTNPKAL
jgi:uncharacterized RDD family membrane protein YckC